MEIVERDGFCICGYVVETSIATAGADVAWLYADFSENGWEDVLLQLGGAKRGRYGLMWYTQGHERYCYLLGIEVGADNALPAGALLQRMPRASYAVAQYDGKKDAMEAWTEFFFTDLPGAGFAPDARINLYFEYYPEEAHGDYELWTPVVLAPNE